MLSADVHEPLGTMCCSYRSDSQRQEHRRRRSDHRFPEEKGCGQQRDEGETMRAHDLDIFLSEAPPQTDDLRDAGCRMLDAGKAFLIRKEPSEAKRALSIRHPASAFAWLRRDKSAAVKLVPFVTLLHYEGGPVKLRLGARRGAGCLPWPPGSTGEVPR
jgi:hypothetical protein